MERKDLGPAVETGLMVVGLLLLTSGSAVSRAVRDRVLLEQEYKCANCGRQLPLQMHHIVPKKLFGSNNRENIAGLCESCHDVMNKQAFKGKLVGGKSILEVGEEHFLKPIHLTWIRKLFSH